MDLNFMEADKVNLNVAEKYHVQWLPYSIGKSYQLKLRWHNISCS